MSSTGAEDGVGTKVVIGVIGVIAAIAAVAALLVVLFGARVLIGGSSADEEPAAGQTQGGTAPGEETPGEPIPSTPDRRQVTLIARPDRQAQARSTYADLSDGEVLRMAIRRDGSSRGTIEQCVVRRRDGADSTCADPILGTAAPDGRFSATIEIDDECNRCQVLVSAGPRELAAPLSIADGPGAAYSVRRLLSGLAAAIGFLAAAVLIARRTDWRPPSEAATPAFDGPWRWDDLPDDG